MYKSCAFSGHRDLFKYDFDAEVLDRVVLRLILTGTEKFFCGMALGFDLAAAESVLNYRDAYGVKLIACLPCANQSDRFSAANKIRYESVLSRCDEVVSLAPIYFSGCMQARDRYMIDNSDALVCFLRKKSGGTYYTVKYAANRGIKIIEL